MRLPASQIAAIKSEVADAFGVDARVWLFGSRVRDDSKGGDIDLYIELPASTERVFARTVRLNGNLQIALGEQQIDVVTHIDGAPMQSIDRVVRAEGVLL